MYSFWRCIKKYAVLLVVVFSFTKSLVIAEAGGVNPFAVLIGVASISGVYQSELNAVLDFGNSAYNQAFNFRHDMKTNGYDRNDLDVELVNEIMEKIIGQSRYVLDIRAVPFLWGINDLEEVNACCYPTNYISVNRGLIEGFGRNQDEIAAVLGHEMTHGILQHSASVYAKSIAQYLGMSFLNAMTGAMHPEAVAILSDYSAAKNFTLPIEYEADAGGFYLMTDAGFNPGGPCAAMARLDFLSKNLGERAEPYDHPATLKREARLKELMTLYSAGHVSVIDDKYITIDDEILLQADWTDPLYDNTKENAYLIAGALARAFHDFTDFSYWNFQEKENGRITYLTSESKFNLLKHFVERQKKEALLRRLVKNAYDKEKITLQREKMLEDEERRTDTLKAHTHKNTMAKDEHIKTMLANADAYVDLGDFKRARFLFLRLNSLPIKEYKASLYASWARLYAYEGDEQKALSLLDKALDLDQADPYNFLNKADVLRSLGKAKEAVKVLEKAKKLDPLLALTHKILGDLLDELYNKKEAQKAYDEYLRLTADKNSIPKEYLPKE